MSKVRDLLNAIDYEHLRLEEFLESLQSIDNISYVDPNKARLLADAAAKVKQIRESMTGDENWEDVAIYFADCEAATAYTYGSTKSLSMYETKRHISICQTMLASLEAGALMGKGGYSRPSRKEDAMQQLRKVIETCQKKVDNSKSPSIKE